MTKYAKLILDIVNSSSDHPTADQIFNRLKAQCPRVVVATVYNNLNALSEQGLIRRLTVSGGSDRFDSVKPHDHLICSKCGTISDIMLTDLSSCIQEQLGRPIDSYDLNVYYLCDNCKEES